MRDNLHGIYLITLGLGCFFFGSFYLGGFVLLGGVFYVGRAWVRMVMQIMQDGR